MINQYAKWIVTHPRMVLLVVFLSVIGAGGGLENAWMTTDYKVYFGPEDPTRLDMERLEADYVKEASVIIVVAPKGGDVFEPGVLRVVAELTEAAWLIPHAGRVESIANYQYSHAEGDEIIIEALFETPGQLDSAEIAKRKAALLSEPLVVGRLLAKDGRATVIYVTMNLGDNLSQQIPVIAGHVRGLLAESSSPAIEFYLTGTVMADQAFTDATRRDLSFLIPLSYALIVLVLALLLRSIPAMGITLGVVTFAVVYALGIKCWLDGAINPMTAAAPTMIATIAVADCVHLFVHFFQQYRRGGDRTTALTESLAANMRPVFLTSITTIIGFLCLNFSQSPPLRELGNIVALGVAAAFFLAITLLPALIVLLPIKASWKDRPAFRMEAFSHWVVNNARRLVIVLGIAIVCLLAGLPRNQLNEVYTDFFDETFEIKRAYNYIDQRITGLHRLNFSLPAGAAGGISDPEYLSIVAAFADWLKRQPEVAHVAAITDIMKRLNQNMHGDDPAYYRLPETRELAAQYLLLYEFSLPYGQDLNDRITQDKSASRVIASLWLTDSDTLLAFERKARQWLSDQGASAMAARAIGIDIMFSEIARRNIPSMIFGTFAALVLISLLIMLSLRSFRLGGISLLSNLFPALMAFGLWGFLYGRLGLTESTVVSLTLGLVVDDTVHFLHRYRQARAAGMTPNQAIQHTLCSVGVALIITTLVFAVGFGVLAFSHYTGSAHVGLLTAITILCALMIDFLLLPGLLLWSEHRDKVSDPERRVGLRGAKR